MYILPVTCNFSSSNAFGYSASITSDTINKNKYPDATVDDIVEATNQLYSIDISSDWDADEFANAYKEFESEGRLYMLFKDRILVAYRRTRIKNQNNNETGKNIG